MNVYTNLNNTTTSYNKARNVELHAMQQHLLPQLPSLIVHTSN